MCWEQNNIKMINGSINSHPMEVWISNHAQNENSAHSTSVTFPQDKSWWASVVCVAPTCLYALPTNTSAVSDETTEVLLRVLLPNQSISPSWTVCDATVFHLWNEKWCPRYQSDSGLGKDEGPPVTLSYFRRTQGSMQSALDMWISSELLVAVRAPFVRSWRTVWPLKKCLPRPLHHRCSCL